MGVRKMYNLNKVLFFYHVCMCVSLPVPVAARSKV